MAKVNPIAAIAVAGVGLLVLSRAGRASGSTTTKTKAPSAPTTTATTKKRRTDLPTGIIMDEQAARREAPAIAAEVTSRQYDYDRVKMSIFQQHAGLDGDGLYGPRTASALEYYGVKPAPRALFKGATSTYLPPAGLSPNLGVTSTVPPIPMGPPAAPLSRNDASGMDSALRAAVYASQGSSSAPSLAPPQERGDDEPASQATPSNLDTARREAPALAKHLAIKKQNYSRQSVKSFQGHAGLVPDGFYGPVTRSALQYFGVKNPPPALAKGKPGGVSVYTPPA